jgi:hypothetical protein
MTRGRAGQGCLPEAILRGPRRYLGRLLGRPKHVQAVSSFTRETSVPFGRSVGAKCATGSYAPAGHDRLIELPRYCVAGRHAVRIPGEV